MSPFKDTKKGLTVTLASTNVEQQAALENTASAASADRHDLTTPVSFLTDDHGPVENLKVLSPAVPKLQREAEPKRATTISWAKRVARLHLNNRDDGQDSSSCTTTWATLIKERKVPSVWSNYESLGAARSETWPSSPLVLSGQEAPRPDLQEDGGDKGRAPAELIELTEPIATGGGGNGTPPPIESSGEQEEAAEEWDPRDREDYPIAPPPSPASTRRRLARFEEFFTIRRSALGGLGAFAARELKRGQTILVESPLLRTTHFQILPDYYNLSKAAKKAYLSLHGAENGDPFSRVERIKTLNSFAVPGGIAIFEIASRFNHACPSAQNVQYVFDNERGVLSLTICQDVVPAGAELAISYGTSTVDLYSTYGFKCVCGGCDPPLTDEDIETLKKQEYGDWGW
ncbi:hypothetical protein C8A00DRAFT_29314 [Chaetomidium leptoderma]|uniref:SET domain-containing protein n=1 Tax=Chaetomidium leptoderma TaxID=669021 RepID=A0AAN7A0P9_9PEZI|nr:hypothetical protein C8A00DRAFT_29314 [Chaetomidium leptoderma]